MDKTAEWTGHTLSAYKNQWNLSGVAVMGHFRVVVVDGIERRFIFQAEHENDCIHPSGKLQN